MLLYLKKGARTEFVVTRTAADGGMNDVFVRVKRGMAAGGWQLVKEQVEQIGDRAARVSVWTQGKSAGILALIEDVKTCYVLITWSSQDDRALGQQMLRMVRSFRAERVGTPVATSTATSSKSAALPEGDDDF